MWTKERFQEALAQAHKAERAWVDHRRDEGLAVAHGVKEVLRGHDPSIDHCLNPDAVAAVQIEVKVRSIDFTGPHDWPHPTVFVDDMYGLRGGNCPFAWVYISKRTGSWVWLSALDMDDDWTEQVIYDGMRKYDVPTLVCPRHYLRHADELRGLILRSDLMRIEGEASAFRGRKDEGSGRRAPGRGRRPPGKAV